jgi:hypothetical protein
MYLLGESVGVKKKKKKIQINLFFLDGPDFIVCIFVYGCILFLAGKKKSGKKIIFFFVNYYN